MNYYVSRSIGKFIFVWEFDNNLTVISDSLVHHYLKTWHKSDILLNHPQILDSTFKDCPGYSPWPWANLAYMVALKAPCCLYDLPCEVEVKKEVLGELFASSQFVQPDNLFDGRQRWKALDTHNWKQ